MKKIFDNLYLNWLITTLLFFLGGVTGYYILILIGENINFSMVITNTLCISAGYGFGLHQYKKLKGGEKC